ncbi:MAG: NADH-quinone oxidoreductase subunit N [Cytophagaceae bacterium]
MNSVINISDVLSGINLLLPEIFLLFTALVVLISGLAFRKSISCNALASISLAGSVLSFSILLIRFSPGIHKMVFSGMLYYDTWTAYFKILIFTSLIIAIVFSIIRKEQAIVNTEYYTILLVLSAALMFLTLASNLLSIYLSLEFVSICSYILSAFRFNKESAEGSLKYILFGIFSGAVMLYGISLLYGLSGSLELFSHDFLANLSQAQPVALWFAVILTTAGFLFKIAAVPFHQWAPDVYQTAPIPVTAFFSTAPKIAGFALFYKFSYMLITYLPAAGIYVKFLSVIVFISLTVGNLAALWQQNAKRILSYSSIAHSGFILMTLLTVNNLSVKALMFYLAVLIPMNFAAFIMVDKLVSKSGSERIDSFNGLGKAFPVAGILMVIIMISLTGLPPTAGFYAKFMVFSSVWETYQVTQEKYYLYLLLFGILNTLPALFYYLKIPFVMFFRKAENNESLLTYSISASDIFVSLLSVPLLIFFLKPDWLTSIIQTFLP